MRESFTQKFIMTVLAGFAAACLFWGYRHIVVRSIYETSDEGVKEMFQPTPRPGGAR
jgi:hypothetical protein